MSRSASKFRRVTDAVTPKVSEATPFISIVVPTRDRSSLLVGAIASLKGQDYARERYEIVVVDDGSKDDLAHVITERPGKKSLPTLRLVRQPPIGSNSARNRGIRHANGSIIVFFDDDEEAPSTWLTAIVRAMERHSDAMCIGGPYRLRFEGRPPRLCSRCWPGEGTFEWDGGERPVANVLGGNMAIRREAFAKAGVFDESIGQFGGEVEWMMRLLGAGETIVYVPEAWVWHRRTREQLRMWNRLQKQFAIGRGDARFQARFGDLWNQALRSYGHPTWRKRRVTWVPRLFGHALKARCTGGLTAGVAAMGFAFEDRVARSSR